MTEINLCNEVLENAIGVHRSLEKIETLNPIDAVAVQAMEELLKYRAIGTIEEFQALKEKSVAKKPIERERNYLTVFDCPTCNAELYSGQRFCDECGQSISDDYE